MALNREHALMEDEEEVSPGPSGEDREVEALLRQVIYHVSYQVSTDRLRDRLLDLEAQQMSSARTATEAYVGPSAEPEGPGGGDGALLEGDDDVSTQLASRLSHLSLLKFRTMRKESAERKERDRRRPADDKALAANTSRAGEPRLVRSRPQSAGPGGRGQRDRNSASSKAPQQFAGAVNGGGRGRQRQDDGRLADRRAPLVMARQPHARLTAAVAARRRTIT